MLNKFARTNEQTNEQKNHNETFSLVSSDKHFNYVCYSSTLFAKYHRGKQKTTMKMNCCGKFVVFL